MHAGKARQRSKIAREQKPKNKALSMVEATSNKEGQGSKRTKVLGVKATRIKTNVSKRSKGSVILPTASSRAPDVQLEDCSEVLGNLSIEVRCEIMLRLNDCQGLSVQ